MSRDAIGDFLTIIRNGIARSKEFVIAPYSNMRFELAKILKEEGFVDNYVVIEAEQSKKGLKLFLRYFNGESAIHEITRKSTPGRRQYARVNELKPVIGGLGVAILTTSSGIMTNKRAKELKVGGEVICTVW